MFPYHSQGYHSTETMSNGFEVGAEKTLKEITQSQQFLLTEDWQLAFPLIVNEHAKIGSKLRARFEVTNRDKTLVSKWSVAVLHKVENSDSYSYEAERIKRLNCSWEKLYEQGFGRQRKWGYLKEIIIKSEPGFLTIDYPRGRIYILPTHDLFVFKDGSVNEKSVSVRKKLIQTVVKEIHSHHENLPEITENNDNWGEWRAHAACLGKNTELFFSAYYRDVLDALRICRSCPVVKACIKASAKEEFGIWGGITEDKRRMNTRREEMHHHQSFDLALFDEAI